MVNDCTRRNFLRTAPLAAAVTLSLTDGLPLASDGGQSAGSVAPEPFQVFTAETLADAMKALQAKPGTDKLYEPTALPLTIVLTTDESNNAKEIGDYGW